VRHEGQSGEQRDLCCRSRAFRRAGIILYGLVLTGVAARDVEPINDFAP